MLKRILLLLGESASSEVARAYAFRLAKDVDASVAGLGGIDLSALQMPSLGRAGAAVFQAQLEDGLRRQAEEMRARLHADYEASCRDHGVCFEWLAFEGDPLAALHLAVETRDLVVTGHDTAFQGGVQTPLPDLLARLLAATPRPFLVLGDEDEGADEILVAYDGSLPAMRAVQMFALVGLGRGRRIKVVSVDPVQEEAARRASAAASYLSVHGLHAEEVAIGSRLDPTEVIRLEVGNLRAGTLVMGSYGRSGWREVLFGSTTGKLVENPPCALFIYH